MNAAPVTATRQSTMGNGRAGIRLLALAVTAAVLSAFALPATAAPLASGLILRQQTTAKTASPLVTVGYRHREWRRKYRKYRTYDHHVDAPYTRYRGRGRVVVDAPYAYVRRGRDGVRVRAPYVDLYIPR